MFCPYGIRGIENSPSDYHIGVRGYSDALVWPTPKAFVWPGEPTGVYENSGHLVREAGIERVYGRITAKIDLNVDAKVDYVQERVVFGGYIVDHFGHFILESLSRLWALRECNLRIVWACASKLKPYQAEILHLMGISEDRHLFVTAPTIFERIWVPTPGYIISKWFHDEQVRALGRLKSRPRGEKIYLSRSRFVSTIANVASEEVIETELKRAGWRVVFPEALSFAEQLEVISSASHLAAIEGSALHPLVFFKEVEAKVTLLRRSTANKNFDTIAEVKGFDQVSIFDHLSENEKQDGKRVVRLIDPKAAAAAILQR